MRVLICGDRKWNDDRLIQLILEGLIQEAIVDMGRLVIIEGCAKGADWVAHSYYNPEIMGASHKYIQHEHYPAQWKKYGNIAGPIRNQQMIEDGKPDEVFTFHDTLTQSKGTWDIVKRAKAAGIPVRHIQHFWEG
jgi:hypothetical protein